ncbi:MAG: hypothetical protein ACTSPK_05800 [Candidatus Heimdallarchaeota archaeon]
MKIWLRSIIAVLFLVGFTTIGKVNAALGDDVGSIILLIEILVGVFIGGLVSGVIAGERRIAMISSGITAIPVIGILIGLQVNAWTTIGITSAVFNSLLYFLIFSAISILGGIIGGYKKNKIRRRTNLLLYLFFILLLLFQYQVLQELELYLQHLMEHQMVHY